MIERVVVSGDMDAADNWIAERAGKGAIVITADIPLAARAVKAGATVIAPNGKPFTESAIGMTLATRNLMADLRAAGAVTSRAEAVCAARPLGVSPRARSGDRAARARGVWTGGLTLHQLSRSHAAKARRRGWPGSSPAA